MKTLCLLLAACIPLFGATQELRTFTLNGLYGFTKNDRVVIPPTFNYAANFSSGRAAVLLNKKWGFIDTKGQMVIPNTFEHVESFRNGFALYYEGKKVGLIDSMGNKVVPAVCDEIYEYSNYFSLRKDQKYGSYLPKSNVYIEPKYGNYYLSNHFIVAKNGNFFDVFTEDGKLVGPNVTHSPRLLGRYNTTACDLVWEDSVRIVDRSGNSVTKTYSGISELNCETQKINPLDGNYQYSYHVYLLHLPSESMIYDEYGNEMATNAFHLYFEDGRLVDDAVYSDFSNANDEYNVKRNNLLCGISREGELIPSNYIGKDRFASYTLFYLPDSTVDVAQIVTNYDEYNLDYYGRSAFSQDTTIVAHFKRVRILMQEAYVEYYNPEYLTDDAMIAMIPISYEVVEVEGDDENSGKFALYDFVRKLYITPFDKQHKELSDIEYEYRNKTYAVFRNERGLLAYSVDGKSSPYRFDSYEKLYGMGYVFRDTTGKSVFVNFNLDTALTIPKGIDIYSSSKVFTGESYYVDVETGEPIYTDGRQEFNFEFLLLSNTTEPYQFGFVDYRSNLVLPKYDSIFAPNGFYANDQQYPVVSVKKNGKYGAYDLKLGSAIEPAYDSILTYYYSSEYDMAYTQPIGKPYYVNTKGKKFKTLNYEIEVFTKNKKKGFRNGSDFEETDYFNDTVVPAIYKDLKPVYDIPYCIATNAANKQGVINVLGDTIIPFLYDDIYWDADWYFPDGNYGYGWFKTTKGKQKGAYNVKLGKEIPPIYDEIIWIEAGYEYLKESVDGPSMWQTYNALIVVKDEKCGMYSDFMLQFFPDGNDGIDMYPIGETMMMNVQRGDQVGCFYFNPYGTPEVNLPDRWYDFVVEGYGYRKIEGGYAKYEIVSAIYMGDVETFEVDPEICYYEVFEEEGLLGLRDTETKKVVMKPQLRYLHFIESDTVVKFVDGITYYGSIYKKKDLYPVSEW